MDISVMLTPSITLINLDISNVFFHFAKYKICITFVYVV